MFYEFSLGLDAVPGAWMSFVGSLSFQRPPWTGFSNSMGLDPDSAKCLDFRIQWIRIRNGEMNEKKKETENATKLPSFQVSCPSSSSNQCKGSGFKPDPSFLLNPETDPYLLTQRIRIQSVSVPDPWDFGMDPDPLITDPTTDLALFVSELQDANKK